MMRTIFRYILLVIIGYALMACTSGDSQHFGEHDVISVEYIARPSSFVEYKASSPITKAVPSESNPTDLEKLIVDAYFLVYGNDGERIEMRKAVVENNQIQPQVLYHNHNKGPLTICYLVNVRESYADSLDNISKFSNPDYAYKMTYAAPSVTKHIGVPLLGDTPCFPMLGTLTQTYENNQLSGVVNTNSNYTSTISLKRLFSKIYFQIAWDNQVSTENLFAEQGFTLHTYTLHNLPKYVSLADPNGESAWVKNDSYFADQIEVTNSQQTGLLTNVELTLYTPEYTLIPENDKVSQYEALADNQKHKPSLYDPDKNAIHLTIDGTVKATNFVSVPLEYTIYLGENAFDSFSLYRNNQYNNLITITGTGDAILGKDERVVATYHNLADPTNSGTDRPANCYIIGRPGRYLIPTYRGPITDKANADYAMLDGIDISKTATHSDGKNSITNLKFTPDSAGRNWVRFDVNMTIADNAITDLPSIQDGNSVLEFKNSSGTTVWSWHLWFTSGGTLGSEWGTISSETYSGTNATMMNRNLGASAAGEIGTYYLWGDKDPFMTPTGKGADYYGGTSTGSWSSSTKSVTDPCPPGYMVPSSKVWLSNSAWKGTTAGQDGSQLYSGAGFIYDMRDPNVLYPFASYLNNKTRVTHSVSDWSGELKNNDFGGTIYYKERYSLADGLVWTSSQNQGLYYGVKKMQAEVSGALYKVPFSGEIKIESTSSFWKYVSDIADKFVEWFVSKDKAVYENPGTTTVLNTSSGLQVRCVSETSTVK